MDTKDRELLELAAKSLGFDTSHPLNAERLEFDPPIASLVVRSDEGYGHTAWNPIRDSGEALRIAAHHGLSIVFNHDEASVIWMNEVNCEYFDEKYQDEDRLAAARIAIVRAAAEIGRAKQ